jgi:hypothetical protein
MASFPKIFSSVSPSAAEAEKAAERRTRDTSEDRNLVLNMRISGG